MQIHADLILMQQILAIATTAPVQDANVVSELQVDFSDHDSSLGDEDRGTISTSINSTVTSFRREHGRRYHAFEENQYWLPNEDTEISRLNIHHHCWRLSLGGRLFVAPLKSDVQNVVGIGTGTGEWAIEFAEQFPSAKVVGTDLSPVQNQRAPDNCIWGLGNAEQEWGFEEKFDYVHSRMLLLGIHDWDRYFQQAFQNLKPGGWVEIQEPLFPTVYVEDGGVTEDSPFAQWGVNITAAAAVDNIDTRVALRMKEIMERAGIANVVKQELVWPVGSWAKGEREKALGYWTLENVKLFFDGAKLLFVKRLGWDIERVERHLKEAAEDIERKESHYYWRFFVYYGQKPESSLT